jgi:hypothetical protein
MAEAISASAGAPFSRKDERRLSGSTAGKGFAAVYAAWRPPWIGFTGADKPPKKFSLRAKAMPKTALTGQFCPAPVRYRAIAPSGPFFHLTAENFGTIGSYAISTQRCANLAQDVRCNSTGDSSVAI